MGNLHLKLLLPLLLLSNFSFSANEIQIVFCSDINPDINIKVLLPLGEFANFHVPTQFDFSDTIIVKFQTESIIAVTVVIDSKAFIFNCEKDENIQLEYCSKDNWEIRGDNYDFHTTFIKLNYDLKLPFVLNPLQDVGVVTPFDTLENIILTTFENDVALYNDIYSHNNPEVIEYVIKSNVLSRLYMLVYASHFDSVCKEYVDYIIKRYELDNGPEKLLHNITYYRIASYFDEQKSMFSNYILYPHSQILSFNNPRIIAFYIQSSLIFWYTGLIDTDLSTYCGAYEEYLEYRIEGFEFEQMKEFEKCE